VRYEPRVLSDEEPLRGAGGVLYIPLVGEEGAFAGRIWPGPGGSNLSLDVQRSRITGRRRRPVKLYFYWPADQGGYRHLFSEPVESLWGSHI